MSAEHAATTSRVGDPRPSSEQFAIDVADAVALDHRDCTDAICDIHEALEAGLPLTAAWLLLGAAETPNLDLALGKHKPGARWAEPEHSEWEAHVAEFGRRCPTCGSVTFADPDWDPEACAGCGDAFPDRGVSAGK